ncbi:HU family DNA-binding protein [Streptomyces sp. NPDC093261]|uniref:HU family DNA-binding protein n=1 Tax=Streptomyces sp. NPDC093261 TaxID=3366037 RepID=UPI00381E17D4
MNYTQLAEAVSEETGIHANDVKAILRSAADVITRETAEGGSVAITNFGTFKGVDAARRLARNPQTGRKVTVPAHRVVRFKPSARMSELVRREKSTYYRRPVTTAKRPKTSALV